MYVDEIDVEGQNQCDDNYKGLQDGQNSDV